LFPGVSLSDILHYYNSFHLHEKDLLPFDDKCLFCSGINRKNIFLIQEEPEIFLALCKNCFAVSATRIPNKDFLKHHYQINYRNKSRKMNFNNSKKLAWHIFKLVNKFSKTYIHKNKQIRIIDFGCGDGAVSIALSKMFIQKEHSVDLILVDTNIDLDCHTQVGASLSIKKYNDLSDFDIHDADIVIASAVMEHIPFPVPILKDLFKKLKKGGFLYIRVPCVVSLLRVLNFFRIRPGFPYPGHLHDLGQGFWQHTDILKDFLVLYSRPSPVETSFRFHFLRTLLAYILKAPWYIFRSRYVLIGGLEIFSRKLL